MNNSAKEMNFLRCLLCYCRSDSFDSIPLERLERVNSNVTECQTISDCHLSSSTSSLPPPNDESIELLNRFIEIPLNDVEVIDHQST
ncbi:hypothetical protein BLOT_014297 [Blomia tropicalis]|nr:hypothetical protein BLOT_014297 [Blomia tropicalis]